MPNRLKLAGLLLAVTFTLALTTAALAAPRAEHAVLMVLFATMFAAMLTAVAQMVVHLRAVDRMVDAQHALLARCHDPRPTRHDD